MTRDAVKPKTRDRLIAISLDQLRAGGFETLSLREIADIAGVAPSAPYRHFRSKDALIAELAEVGFAELRTRYCAAAESAGPAPSRLAALIAAYFDFAVGNRELFQLMFSRRFALEMDDPEDSHGRKAFRVFEALVAEANGQISPHAIRMTALSLWGAMHGNALLLLNGRMIDLDGLRPTLADIVDEIVRRYAPVPAEAPVVCNASAGDDRQRAEDPRSRP